MKYRLSVNRLLIIIIGVALLAACKPSTPDNIIQPGDMEDLLVDYHLAYGMATQQGGSPAERNYNQVLYTEEVLRKHGVTRAEFDSSLVYYYSRSDRFDKIYSRIAERLDRHALSLGASESDIGKYASLNADGDTANIWNNRPAMVLMPKPPYNRMEFELQADSSYLPGDKYLLQFMTEYIYQSGSRDGVVVVATTFDNDSTITRTMTFGNNGLTQLHLMGDNKHAVKTIRGFFYLGGALETTTVQRLLFIDNIQFIRFHKEHEATPTSPAEAQTDSLTRTADRERTDTTHASGRDSIGKSSGLLQTTAGTGSH